MFWVIMHQNHLLGSIFAEDRDTALDIACMRYAGEYFEPGDDSELRALHPEDDF